MWQRSQIRFVLESALTEGDVATMRITTPAGDLLVMGETEQSISGDTLRVRRFHMNAPPGMQLTANSIGAATCK